MLAISPAAVFLACLNSTWYGAPWRSGYGDTQALFQLSRIAANLQRYPTWLVETHGILPFCAAVALVPWPSSSSRAQRTEWWLAAAAVIVAAAYLPYFVFDAWHFLRFLLPGIALLLPLAAEGISRLVQPSKSGWRTVAFALLVAAQCTWMLRVAADRETFALPQLESRYALTAAWVRRATPENAIVLASQQSGSLGLNAHRSIVRWDLVPSDRMPGLLDRLAAGRRPIVLVVESWERPLIADLHRGQPIGTLDWPPAAIVSARVRVDVYVLGDRARYNAGKTTATERVMDRR